MESEAEEKLKNINQNLEFLMKLNKLGLSKTFM